jgi:hypothetical protein
MLLRCPRLMLLRCPRLMLLLLRHPLPRPDHFC